MTLHAARHEGRPSAPLLLTFHGTGGDENQFFDFAARLLPEATIVSPREAIGRIAAEQVIARIEGKPIENTSHNVSFELCIGEST